MTKIGGITAWTNGVIGRRSDGAFTYDSGTGHQSNSWDNPGQFALFRLVGPESTHYFLGIEDIPLRFAHNDRDYNDYVVKFETHRSRNQERCCSSVPEWPRSRPAGSSRPARRAALRRSRRARRATRRDRGKPGKRKGPGSETGPFFI